MPAPGRRLPIANLLDKGGYRNLTELAVALGVRVDQLRRDERSGGFTEVTADRYACRVKLATLYVWPEYNDFIVEGRIERVLESA